MDNLYLYGPPGAGKTTTGKLLAAALALPFIDLDDAICGEAGMSIPEIFAAEGEAGFRRREQAALRVATQLYGVIALGGGALLATEARALAEGSGQVVCLVSSPEALLARLQPQAGTRPLLSSGERLADKLQSLLAARGEHYRSFPLTVDTTGLTPEDAVWQTQLMVGRFLVKGMGQPYAIQVEPNSLNHLGEILKANGLKGPVALVSDKHVMALHGERAALSLRIASYEVTPITIPAGEGHKNIETMQSLWAGFAQARLERGSTVVALGGGVVGDLTGFAAATFLRGVNWVNVPTTLLAMVDSSMGGKTGFDLPQGKNLVGAFYPPRLVLADPQVLATLPERELRGGLAETIKHGVIADPGLFELCAKGIATATKDLTALVRRGMAVKVKVIEADPFERGIRQALNLGHTVGHGVELASDFNLSHGEAVAIGMVVEARLAEAEGIAEPGLADRICEGVGALQLPVSIPTNLSRDRIIEAMGLDKKRAGGKVRFALPERIGSVRVGVEVDGWQEKII